MPHGACAYCRKPSPLTKEHIWPRWVNKRESSYVMRFSARAKKVFSGDLVVSDVCAACNNGPLSALDAEAERLHERYFAKILGPEDRISFEYDHDNLVRWLLKVSFNSARATGQDVGFHLPLANYMLGEATKPEFVSVTLDGVAPSVVNGKTLEPRATRCARVFIGRSRPWVCLRLVAINSYYFYIVITAEKPTPVPESELLEFRAGIKGHLLPRAGHLNLPEPTSDFYEMHAPHLLGERKLYEEFLAKYRKVHPD